MSEIFWSSKLCILVCKFFSSRWFQISYRFINHPWKFQLVNDFCRKLVDGTPIPLHYMIHSVRCCFYVVSGMTIKCEKSSATGSQPRWISKHLNLQCISWRIIYTMLPCPVVWLLLMQIRTSWLLRWGS